MKRKHIILILIILLVICGGVWLFKSNFVQVEVENTTNNVVEDVVPEAEITDEQLRVSKVKLFFENEKGEIVEEERDIDVKELINNPYKGLITLLISGPEMEGNKKLIPEGTNILETERVGDILEINFSKEFIDNCENDVEKQERIVKSILYTLKELREINGIQILVEGEKVEGFKNNGYKLSDAFLFE